MKEKEIKILEDLINNDYSNTAGITVLKNGRTIYEKYFNNCTEVSRIHVYSVTKSIISLLIGIALDNGHIRSINQKVLDFFPEYKIKRGEKNIQNITLKHMLTMTAPYKYKRSTPYIRYFTSDDMVKFCLDLLGGKQQPGEFRYTPLIGPDILSGILVKATGQSVFDFASENLFSPLGITVENNIVFNSKEEQLAFNKANNISGWVIDKTGVNTAGWGLTLSCSDMARIGQLFLDKGIYNDNEIVSAHWLEECTIKHSRWEEMNISYGYLWWIINEDEQSCAAMGDGGNIIYFNKRKNIVISSTAFFMRNAKDRLELIQKQIMPILERG